MEQCIYSILTANEEVFAEIGNRIAPVIQAQFTAFPFVTYSVTGYEPTITHSGAIVGAKTTVQIDTWALTYKDATLLQITIRRALQGFKGEAGGINVRNITTDGRTSLGQQLPDGAEKPVYTVSSDYDVLHIDS
jgi:hypothetical protein